MFSFLCQAQDKINEIENSIPEGVFKVITGKIFSKELPDTSLLLLINSNPAQSNFNSAFILSSENKLLPISTSESDEYTVIIPKTKAYILLINKKQAQISFIGIANNYEIKTKAAIASNSLLKQFTLQEFLGYGLSYNRSTWDALKIMNSPYHFAYNILHNADLQNPAISRNLSSSSAEVNPNSISPGGSCTSGGTGATQCSIDGAFGTGCSVTCGTGYYACCDDNTVKCYCVKNP